MDTPPQRFFEFDTFRVDVLERQLWQAGKTVPLTPKAFDILLILLENKGITVEKNKLMQEVWADTFVEEGILNRNISTLRKALGDDSHEQKFIKTLPKFGYRFTAQAEEIFKNEKPFVEAITPTSSHLSKQNKFIFVGLIAIISVAILAWTMSQSTKKQIDLTGLTAHERNQFAKRGSTVFSANADFVKGRTLWHQRSAEALHQSIICLERAVRTDPNFALAHAALADAYAFDTVKKDLAKKHAEEAIRLDSTLGEPFATLGFVQMFWEWKLLEAKDSFAKAVLLSPDYATAHQWYALNLIANRFGGAALSEMKRAVELEPKSLAINADLCQVYYFLQKYDEALAQCRKTLEMDENFLNAHFYLYEIYSAREMDEEAVAEFFKIERLKSDFALPHAQLEKLREAHKKGGIRDFWQTRAQYFAQNPDFYKSAQYHARLGQKEKALEALQKSFERRDFDFVFFITEPVFQDLVNEPKFIELVRLFRQKE